MLHSVPAACPAEFIAPLTAPEYRRPTSRQMAQAQGSIASPTPNDRIISPAVTYFAGVRAAAKSKVPEIARQLAPIALRPMASPNRLASRSLDHPPTTLPTTPMLNIKATHHPAASLLSPRACTRYLGNHDM